MQFESYIGPGNDGIFALVEITDFTPSTVPDFYAHPEEDDGEPATVEWHFVDDDGNRDTDLHIAATEADIERITQEAIDVGLQRLQPQLQHPARHTPHRLVRTHPIRRHHMNPQHLPQFTGPRFHRRELRYTQAPAAEYVQPLTARQCYPIEHTPRPSRFIRHTLYSVAVGLLVVAALVGCGDDLDAAQLAAEDVAEAQAQAVELHREAVALAALVGSKH